MNNHVTLRHGMDRLLVVIETEATFTDQRHDKSRFLSAVLTSSEARVLAADLIRRADEVDL